MEPTLSIAALLGLSMASCLLAGVFLTFSDFAMRSFNAASDGAGVEVMQVLNRVIYRSGFMVLFLAMVPMSLAVGFWAVWGLDGAAARVVGLAAALYLVGVFGVTAFGNVPMNTTLDRLPLGGAQAQAYWPQYLRGWLGWNHLRTIAALGAALSYAVAAVMLAGA